MKFGRYDSCMDTPFKTIREAHIQGKRVLLRVDFNVSLAEDGSIVDDTRIKKSLPTIELLLRNDNKLIIISHLGRPEKRDKENSLAPVALRLQELLNKTVTLVDDFLSEQGKTQLSGQQENEILLLENIRFYKEEQENDSGFAKKLSALGDCYVNDAFGVSHRNDASIVGIPQFLPSFMGLLLEKEVASISSLVKNPSRPFVAIIGGAKIETKLPLVEKMHQFADYVLVGGKIAEETKVLLKVQHEKVNPPTGGRKSALLVADLNNEETDITPKDTENFLQIINLAQTIVWNGPVGKTEGNEKNLEIGTAKLAKGIAESGAYTVVGGGDTIGYLRKIGLLDKFSFVSTGGGAMLEFLSGEKLPGIEVLV